MLRYIFILISSIVVSQTICGQDKPFTKETFNNDKTKLKEAQRAIKEGDEYYNMEEYYTALDRYLIANSLNGSNAELNYKIGSAWLLVEPQKAMTYMQKAYELNPGIRADILYLLAYSYQHNEKYEEAIVNYNKFRQVLLPSDEVEIESVKKRLEECSNGIKYLKDPSRAFITNLKELNSSYSEHSPVISADESVMLFTSTRSGSIGGEIQIDNEYDEDIYVSYKKDGKWSAPINVGAPLNTASMDATVGLSADGQSLLIYNGQHGRGDIQVSVLKGDIWNRPEFLNKEINTSTFQETSASFAFSDRFLYFISDKEGGVGGKDVWYATRDRKGRWSEVKNLGTTINTPYDEESVFMHPDGRTLYFSSKGHNTMGGYDVFKSTRQDNGTWTQPENLGIPINTAGDDMAFVLSASGRNGYYSSKRQGGEGKLDLYMVTFLGPEKPMILSNEDNLLASFNQSITDNAMEKTVELKTIRLTVVKGVILDALTNNPIAAEIEVVDNDKNEIVFSNISNSKTGRFLVSLPSGKNYGLAVKAEGYLFHSENFNIPGATAYQEIEKEIRLNNIKKDVKIVLRNVFFDQGKSILKPESYPELNRLANVMRDVPTLVIEISGHTDNTGSAATNQKLSKDRAKAVVDYLLAQDIVASRLQYEGYGFSQPIADNVTADGRQQNRRVEFKVISE